MATAFRNRKAWTQLASYAAAQWWTLDARMCAHADDPEAATIRPMMAASQRDYLTYGRRYPGWGVFVLRVK